MMPHRIFSWFFCEDLSFDRGDRKPGKDPDEDGYKKVKKGENPPSPDSFYGQLHIYWEMEDPCARFSLELLARCRFFSSSFSFPASWIDADSPQQTQRIRKHNSRLKLKEISVLTQRNDKDDTGNNEQSYGQITL